MFASLLNPGVGGSSLKLFLLGMVVEFARRFVQWVVERFRLRAFSNLFILFNASDWCILRAEYSITAEFNEGDPAYDWIINFIVRQSFYPLPFFSSLTRDFRPRKRSGAARETSASPRNHLSVAGALTLDWTPK